LASGSSASYTGIDVSKYKFLLIEGYSDSSLVSSTFAISSDVIGRNTIVSANDGTNVYSMYILISGTTIEVHFTKYINSFKLYGIA
jgi:hypothetical protein